MRANGVEHSRPSSVRIRTKRWLARVFVGPASCSVKSVPMYQRRRSLVANVGGVLIGGDNPIVVQSMTNTDTADIESTVRQIRCLRDAGSELVRITVNSERAAEAVPRIVDDLESDQPVPIVGDFHYNGHLLLNRYPECAQRLAKYRINPGNVGMGRHRDENFSQMIEVAMKYSKPVRIGQPSSSRSMA